MSITKRPSHSQCLCCLFSTVNVLLQQLLMDHGPWTAQRIYPTVQGGAEETGERRFYTMLSLTVKLIKYYCKVLQYDRGTRTLSGYCYG